MTLLVEATTKSVSGVPSGFFYPALKVGDVIYFREDVKMNSEDAAHQSALGLVDDTTKFLHSMLEFWKYKKAE